jgi:hypothetical protein
VIDDLCRLLADRPWEWRGYEVPEEQQSSDPDDGHIFGLRHASGVELQWSNPTPDANWWAAWVVVEGQEVKFGDEESRRVCRAVASVGVARVASAGPDGLPTAEEV